MLPAPSPIDHRRPLTIASRPAEPPVPDEILAELERGIQAVAFARLTARPDFVAIIDTLEARP